MDNKNVIITDNQNSCLNLNQNSIFQQNKSNLKKQKHDCCPYSINYCDESRGGSISSNIDIYVDNLNLEQIARFEKFYEEKIEIQKNDFIFEINTLKKEFSDERIKLEEIIKKKDDKIKNLSKGTDKIKESVTKFYEVTIQKYEQTLSLKDSQIEKLIIKLKNNLVEIDDLKFHKYSLNNCEEQEINITEVNESNPKIHKEKETYKELQHEKERLNELLKNKNVEINRLIFDNSILKESLTNFYQNTIFKYEQTIKSKELEIEKLISKLEYNN